MKLKMTFLYCFNLQILSIAWFQTISLLVHFLTICKNSSTYSLVYVLVPYFIPSHTTLTFSNMLCPVLKIIHYFDKLGSCHLQDEYIMGGHFWKAYIRESVSGKLNLMVLISAAKVLAAPHGFH
jgi:hypothetical protein